MKDKKICLATGSLHNLFEYDTESHAFCKYHDKENVGFQFKPGNVTLVEPSGQYIYLGQPFIIGGNEYRPDLNLLTFITRTDEKNIKAARESTEVLKNASYETVMKEDAVSAVSDKTLRDYARLIEKTSKTESSNFFGTQEEPRIYYLRYRLPDFLIEHDKRIQQYLANRSEEDVFAFKELIVRFLLEDEARGMIPETIGEIETRFRHDSSVLDRFLESKDPFIQAFRRGKRLASPSLTDTISLEQKEIFELQSEYMRLLARLKNETTAIDIDGIKTKILRQYFLHLGENSKEYDALVALYEEIGQMDEAHVKK